MSDSNFYRTYSIRCGVLGQYGFKIGTETSVQDALHVSFSVEKSRSETPNDAKIQIWNLGPENLKVLDTPDCAIELKAGYDNSNTLLIVGNVSSVVTTLDGNDKMTEISVADGLVELRDCEISVSFNGSVNSKDVYIYVAKKMGLTIAFADDLSYCIMPNGFSFVGKGRNALQKIASANCHNWTIQNKIIQITNPGRSIGGIGYLLNADTGLINIPKRISINTGETGEQKTVNGWEIEYFLNGAIGVNDVIRVESSQCNGYFLVYKITIDGDNYEGDWLCTAQIIEINA